VATGFTGVSSIVNFYKNIFCGEVDNEHCALLSTSDVIFCMDVIKTGDHN